MEKFTSYRKKIITRVEHNTLASNLVYPLEKGYSMVMKCDKDFVESRLRFRFNLTRAKNYDVIQNKYAISYDFMGQEMIVYNQNGNYYLIKKDQPKIQQIVDKF